MKRPNYPLISQKKKSRAPFSGFSPPLLLTWNSRSRAGRHRWLARARTMTAARASRPYPPRAPQGCRAREPRARMLRGCRARASRPCRPWALRGCRARAGERARGRCEATGCGRREHAHRRAAFAGVGARALVGAGRGQTSGSAAAVSK